jgi:hypothetical protein
MKIPEYVYSKHDLKLINFIDERIEGQAVNANKIKSGSHSEEHLFQYYENLAGFFEKNKKSADGLCSYSDLLLDVISSVMRDFSKYIEQGSAFRNAFGTLNRIREKPELQFRDISSKLKNQIYGAGKPEIAFPDFLSAIWTLKVLRPATYESSLNASKWGYAIAEAINAYSAKNGLGVSVDTDEILTYTMLMNIGMLSPEMPLADTERKFSEEERKTLAEHPAKSLAFLLKADFPIAKNMATIIQHHTDPVDLQSAIAATAETFEGDYFRKRHKDEVKTPREVIEDIGLKLFTKGDLDRLKQQMVYGGRILDMDLIKSNSIILPYYMLRLLLGH